MSLVRRWVDALRDGSYSQTRGTLRDDNGYCCLGVLCDVAGVRWKESEGGDYAAGYHDEWSFVELPWNLRKQAGVPSEFMDELSARNDGRTFQWSGGTVTVFELHDFNQIADVIEQELLNEN